MPENQFRLPRHVRRLTTNEISDHRSELDRLATEFDRQGAALRTPGDLAALPDLRSALSRAGRLLTRLLHHHAVAAPARLPPWLSWRTPTAPRPRFTGLLGRPFHFRGETRTVRGLVSVMRSGPQAIDKVTVRKPHEDDAAVFIRRHTWIEAVAGWLGQRCTPRTSVIVPTVRAVIDTGSGESKPRDEVHVHIVHDWVEDPTQQRLLFLDLARDSAVACRHLAAELGRAANRCPPSPWPTPLSTFDALDDLRMGISHGSGAAGLEAFDILFGVRNLHDELAALGERRQEFKRRFAGKHDTHSIADFAVTSGHEAVAFIAERLAKAANVRRKALHRSRDALEVTRRSDDEVRVAKSEVELDLAGQEFAKALERSFVGWGEHRAWIRRSIEDEIMASDDDSPVTTKSMLDQDRTGATQAGGSPTDKPYPAAGSSEGTHLRHLDEANFADAIASYSQSCDEMRTVRLNPRKAIPIDQWPEETQIRGNAIVRLVDGKRYARYVLRIASENARLAAQARLWWAWWETTQVDASNAGPAPLVSPDIEPALRLAAARRRVESPVVTHAGADADGARAHPSDHPGGSSGKAPEASAADEKARSGNTPTPPPHPQFDKVEQAIALLLRDGRNPRSMRAYAKEVGISHSNLSRNERWQRAWGIASALEVKDVADLVPGEKDSDGTVEALAPPELCDNCRQEPVLKVVTLEGESLRLCEACARKHG